MSEQPCDPPFPDVVPEPEEPEEGQDAEAFGACFRSTVDLGPRTAEQTARAAEADRTNVPGYCLQQTRQWAGIDSLYGSAAVAWVNAERRQVSRQVPRGAFAFWIGGTKGYGHIALGVGGGMIRSTDAGGRGLVATRSLDWFDCWPSLRYAGWTDNVNGVTVPGVMGDGFEMADLDDLRRIVREELRDDEFVGKVAAQTQQAVWDRPLRVTNANGEETTKVTRSLLRELWQKTVRHVST